MDGSPNQTPGTGAGTPAQGARPTLAELITAVRLPMLPPARAVPGPGPCPDTLLDGVLAAARADYDDAAAALAALARFSARVAAHQAALAERLHAAARTEAWALGLDGWQAGVHDSAAVAELATALTIPEQSAHRLMDHSVALVRDHGPTLAALEAGDLSWRHATAVLDHVEAVRDIPGIDPGEVAAFEAELVALAAGATVPKFTEKARRRRERLHPASIETRAKMAFEKRSLVLVPEVDGMSSLHLQLSAAAGQAVWNRCTAAARGLQGPGEPRPLAQLRADVAAALLLGPLGGIAGTIDTGGEADGDGHGPAGDGRGGALGGCGPGGHGQVPAPATQILVTVPALALLGLTDEPAELEGYGPIPASIARDLAAGAPSFLRLLTDPVTGEALDQAPERYRVSEAMRAWLRARDRTCTFPGCNTATAHTELDHLLAWEDGGTPPRPTSPASAPNTTCSNTKRTAKTGRGNHPEGRAPALTAQPCPRCVAGPPKWTEISANLFGRHRPGRPTTPPHRTPFRQRTRTGLTTRSPTRLPCPGRTAATRPGPGARRTGPVPWPSTGPCGARRTGSGPNPSGTASTGSRSGVTNASGPCSRTTADPVRSGHQGPRRQGRTATRRARDRVSRRVSAPVPRWVDHRRRRPVEASANVPSRVDSRPRAGLGIVGAPWESR
ncbi:DUF222 domain-containing protein [Pseudarthrobacter sp. P1]|uniref:HNH endonuclease signature motif containing protein n=1 Tax=Pseudarthrobacter sp. P1 TaxID=3418418 RepID=UPI003CE81E19